MFPVLGLLGSAGPAILSTVGGAIASVGDDIVNFFSQERTNEANKDIHKSDNDYNAHMTQQAWERDDTAHQREVRDLEAAGLSPLANTQGSQVTSPLSAGSPIAMQAPQVDFNSILNTVLQSRALDETERHNKVQEGQKNIELSQTAEQIKQKVQEIGIKDKEVEAQIGYQTRYLNQLADQLAETERHNKAEEQQKKLSWSSENYFKEIEQQTGGKIPYKDYYDLDSYTGAITKWTEDFDAFLDELKETSTSQASGEASAWNGDVNFGMFKSAEGGAGLGHSSSESSSSSQNISQKQQQMIEKFYKTHPMPVFHYYKPEGK